MNAYSSNELVDILIMYGASDCNRHTTWQLYQEHYLNRGVPHRPTFASVDKRLCETVCLTRARMKQQQTSKTPGNEEAVLLWQKTIQIQVL